MLEESQKQNFDDVYMTQTKDLDSRLRCSCLKGRHTAECPLPNVVKYPGRHPFTLRLKEELLSSTEALRALIIWHPFSHEDSVEWTKLNAHNKTAERQMER